MTRIEFLKSLIASLGVEAAFPGVPFVPSGPDDRFDRFDRLEIWEQRPLFPLRYGRDARERQILAAVREKRAGVMTYHGGSTPGTGRVICPILLFLKPRLKDLKEWLRDSDEDDPVVYGARNRSEAEHLDSLAEYLSRRSPSYLLAWCHLRNETRYFRVEKIADLEIF